MDKETIKDFFKRNMFVFAIATISLVYIARGLINIVETGKSPFEILADGAIAFVVGFLITKLFSLQGLMKGEEDKKVHDTNKLYGETLLAISPYIEQLDGYCEIKNESTLKREQTSILLSRGLKYSECIENEYVFKKPTKGMTRKEKWYLFSDNRAKRKAINKAKRLKLTPLTSSSLTSDGGKTHDPYNFGMTKKQYEVKTTIAKLFSKIIFAVIVGYFGVSFTKDFDLSNIIWTSIQITTFLVMGMIDYFKSYFFMIDGNRQRTIKKINELEMFRNDKQREVNNGQSVSRLVQEKL